MTAGRPDHVGLSIAVGPGLEPADEREFALVGRGEASNLEHFEWAYRDAAGLCLAPVAIDDRCHAPGLPFAFRLRFIGHRCRDHHVPETHRCNANVSKKAATASTAATGYPLPASIMPSSTDMPAISVTTARGTSPRPRRRSRFME